MDLKQKDRTKINLFYTASGYAFKLYFKYKEYSENDVLIRWQHDSESKKYDMVSGKCLVPKKFKVVCVDEFNVPWVKQICVKKGLGSNIHSPLEFAGVWEYEIDPEVIDCQLLGIEYEPRDQYKRWREQNPSYGASRRESNE